MSFEPAFPPEGGATRAERVATTLAEDVTMADGGGARGGPELGELGVEGRVVGVQVGVYGLLTNKILIFLIIIFFFFT